MSSAAAPQPDRVLAAVTDLAERLADRGAEIERAGRLPDDVVPAASGHGESR